MKIVTFNIRCDFGQDGINNFDNRKSMIQEKIASESPDLIGFQEVLPHVLDWLSDNLPGYHVVGCGRSADFADECMAIAYRTSTLQLLGLETFWLSPDPFTPGSRYDDQSTCPRICTTAMLKVRDSGNLFRFYNTHLDHETASARYKGINQVLRQMEDDADKLLMPAILVGDFNAVPTDDEIQLISRYTSLGLTDLTAKIPHTYHGYGDPTSFVKIDYIYVTLPFEGGNCTRWEDSKDGIYLSDHYPVAVELKYE